MNSETFTEKYTCEMINLVLDLGKLIRQSRNGRNYTKFISSQIKNRPS